MGADGDFGAHVDGMQRWSRFPITALPRPLIFADRPVRIGERGFVDGDSKLAYMTGAITAEVDLPDGVLEMLIGGRSGSAPRRLRVTGVRAVSASFRCDRGPRPLSAFRLDITGMHQPCTVLDPAVEPWWPADRDWALAERCGLAEVDPDDLTLHYWTGGGQETEFLGARFHEFDAYVVATAITRERPYPPGDADGLVGVAGQVMGRLESPLGNRVLINERGLPCVVTSTRASDTLD